MKRVTENKSQVTGKLRRVCASLLVLAMLLCILPGGPVVLAADAEPLDQSESYTVTFSVLGKTYVMPPVTVNAGESITLPEAECSLEDWVFLGWVTEDYEFEQYIPDEILTGQYTPQDDITLRALFRFPGFYYGYGLVTEYEYWYDEETPDWGGNRHVITWGKNPETMLVLRGIGPDQDYETADCECARLLSEAGITMEFGMLSDMDWSYTFYFDLEDGGYALRNAETGYYLARKWDDERERGYLWSYEEFNSDDCLWTLTLNEESDDVTGNVVIQNILPSNTPAAQKIDTYLGCYYYHSPTANGKHFWLIGGQETFPDDVKQIYLWQEQTIDKDCWTTMYWGVHHHDEADTVIENEIPASCTDTGSYISVFHCSICGLEMRRENVTVPALGHDWGVWEVEIAPTCMNTGKRVRYCERCGLPEREALPALGHDYQAVVTAPTCLEAGFTTWTCSRCGNSYTDEPTAALGHAYQAVVTEPTCTADGFTTHTCSRCGESYTDTPVTALGHDWGAWQVESPPTCGDVGERARYCERCGLRDQETLDALGHDYQAVVTEPTCLESGYTTHTCSRCGDSYTDTPTDALGHDYQAVVTEPTCLEAGFTTHTCTCCGERYTDSPTEALGHDYQAVVTEPSCTDGGFTTHTCSRCGESYTDTPVTPLGHDWSIWQIEIAPTCMNTGKRVRYCERCGLPEREALPALGHDYQAVVTEPTCLEAGFTTWTCSRCGDSYTDAPTDALGHLPGEPVRENYVAPTTTSQGSYDAVTYCQRCGQELSREYIVLDPIPEPEPIETNSLHIYNSISVGTDMVITFSARKTDLLSYGEFWIEVVKHNPEGDETFLYPQAELTESPAAWSVQFRNIYAKEMGVGVEARLRARDAEGQVWMSPVCNANIRDYLGGRLTAANNSEAQRALAADLLNYGAAAQMFTDFQTDHLVNEELTPAQLAKLDEYETKALPSVEKNNANYRPEGEENILFNSLALANEVQLSFNVRLPADAGEVGIRFKDHDTGDEVLTLNTDFSGTTWTAVYSGIGADKMRTVYDFVAVVNGVETGNVRTWSVEGYVGEIRNENLPLKTAMANALLTYGDSAAAYFAAQ